MLTRIVRTSLLHPRLVLAAALLLLGLGIATVRDARYDVFPEFVPAQASLQTEAPGMSPAQVESLVTRPLEQVINGANGVSSIRSESIQGLSVIDIGFIEGSDPYRARQIVAEAIAEVTTQLPKGVQPPQLSPLTSSTLDLLKIGLVGGKSPMELRDLAQWTIRPRLLSVRGVARASLYGGEVRRIEIRARPAAMIARGIAIGDLEAAVRGVTEPRGGGYAETANQRIIVEPSSGTATIANIAAAPIPLGNGVSARVGDVADVVDAATPKFGDAVIMGRPGVLISLSSQYGANTLETTRRVEAAMAELMPAIKKQGVTVYPALHRPANFIETALAGIQRDLLVGAVLIAFVLLVFLRDVRVAVIVFTSIPLSLLAALIVLDRSGQTINTMTLGGLAVALGVVIDDAIVDIENIVRRLRESTDGASRIAIIQAASVEVRAPVVYATYVLIAAVVPIIFLTGLQGAFFAPLAWSFLLATLASLIVAMTVVPALSLLLLGKVALHPEPTFVTRVKNGHARLLARIIHRPRGVIVATVLTAAGVSLLLASFGSELLPSFRERHYVVQINGPYGASLPWMRAIGARISREILAMPEVATAEQQIGRAEAAEDTWPPSKSEIHVRLKAVGGDGEDRVQAGIRAILAHYPMMHGEVVTFLGDRISESLSGETAKVAINIHGPDLDALDRTAAGVARVLATVPGAADVQVKSEPGAPTLDITLDANRLAAHGLASTDAYDAIEAAFQGRVISQITEASRVTDVALTLPAGHEPEAVGQLLVRSADGTTVPLSDVAAIHIGEGRTTIAHEAGQRRQVVTANPTGNDIAGFVASARAAIDRQVKLPPGVYLNYAGVANAQAAATQQVLINVGAASIAIIALLILAFGGGRPAALILATTPFALAGGVIAVAVTGGILSLGALVGFVTLFGIAARNAILLIAHVDHLIEHEHAEAGLETVLRAARERLTPILITALVAGLGLAPLAFEAGQAGREVQGPMAAVILGGLISSTAMSLVLLPALILAYRWPTGRTNGVA
ncbi:MAG: efflux RND transporter permease subunit [Sphingomonas sp.]|jgi:CzcA family heavy metal efflux pump